MTIILIRKIMGLIVELKGIIMKKHYNVGEKNGMFGHRGVCFYGKDNFNYKTGLYCRGKKYYCKICQKNEISLNNFLRGQGKCQECNSVYMSNKYKGKLISPKNVIFKAKKYKGVQMRSSYETKFAFFLDCNDIKWKYEKHTFDLENTTYTPDFYIPEWDLYIEIKGYWRKKNKRKFQKFLKQYSDIKIKVLGYKYLKQYGII